jgi:hypothetical protein
VVLLAALALARHDIVHRNHFKVLLTFAGALQLLTIHQLHVAVRAAFFLLLPLPLSPSPFSLPLLLLLQGIATLSRVRPRNFGELWRLSGARKITARVTLLVEQSHMGCTYLLLPLLLPPALAYLLLLVSLLLVVALLRAAAVLRLHPLHVLRIEVAVLEVRVVRRFPSPRACSYVRCV